MTVSEIRAKVFEEVLTEIRGHRDASERVPDGNAYGPEFTRGYRDACRTIEEAVRALSQRQLHVVDGGVTGADRADR